MAPERRSI